MKPKMNITPVQISNQAAKVAKSISEKFNGVVKVFAFPESVPAIFAVKCGVSKHIDVVIVTDINDADIILSVFPTLKGLYNIPVYNLFEKEVYDHIKEYDTILPWQTEDAPANEESVIQSLLKIIGEDPHREGLAETPARVIKAWRHWTSGYHKNPRDILKVFEDGANNYDQMVVVKDIPIYSHCEHHLAAIIGTATIAYIPNGKIVGLSKLSRLADMFARRLQVQERLTQQIADALQEHLQPLGVGVVIKARHMCMESRGVCQQGHYTVTSALHGTIKDEPITREEFMKIAM